MRIALLYVLVVVLCLAVSESAAGESAGGGGAPATVENPGKPSIKSAAGNTAARVHIVADRLETQRAPSHQAKFSGNVRAVSDTFDITADSLIVFYAPAATGTGPVTGGDVPLEESFDKIIATGNVTIKTGESIAKAEKAVYDKAENVIVLTGENAMVTGESGYISGDRITLHTDSGAVFVESGADKQVEAVIDSEATDNSRQAGSDDG